MDHNLKDKYFILKVMSKEKKLMSGSCGRNRGGAAKRVQKSPAEAGLKLRRKHGALGDGDFLIEVSVLYGID